MQQILLTLLEGAEITSTEASSTLLIDVHDVGDARNRAQSLLDHFYPQGVVIESDIPATILTVRRTGLKEIADPEDNLWENLKSAVAGLPLFY